MRTLGIVLTIVISGLMDCHGFPGKLSEERYEFQQRDIPVEFDEEYDTTTQDYVIQEALTADLQPSWSQLHQNEVNAFAEFYRQSYNQLVDQYNRMFGLQYGYVMPVQYSLFTLPTGYTWQDYFGSQQHFVNQQIEEMSRTLFYKIQNGTISQHELESTSFFIDEAANLLDQIHRYAQPHLQESEYQQKEIIHEGTETEQKFNERDHELVLALNPATGNYEYVYIKKASNEEKPSNIVENVRTSYIQILPSVQFNKQVVHRDIESSEAQSDRTMEHSTAQTTTDNYYGSTYEQQQMYDLQYLESISTSSTPKPNNIMSLVRKKQELSSISTTTPTTTTPKPTTESNIMSMLPHKQQQVDYTNLQQQIRQALDNYMKQHNETIQEETHFMGINSHQDHEKLAYDVVDSPQNSNKEPLNLLSILSTPTTDKIPAEPPLLIPSPSQETRTETSPLYTAPLAPFPEEVYDSNPHYVAHLAPFPAQEFTELEDMNQEHFYPDQHAIIAGHDEQETQIMEQIHHEFILPTHDLQSAMTHGMHQEAQQQIVTEPEFQLQHLEKQQPPEQAFRNPNLAVFQEAVPKTKHEQVAQHQDITTAAPIIQEHYKKPWLQRQWSKLAKHF